MPRGILHQCHRCAFHYYPKATGHPDADCLSNLKQLLPERQRIQRVSQRVVQETEDHIRLLEDA